MLFQAQECEAIIPLCLAGESTSVILAGDHLQMVQRVYSDVARALGFDQSLTERLDNLYHATEDDTGNCSPPVVRLRVNYRNDSRITEFLSSTLYGNKLISSGGGGQQGSVEPAALPPMNFYSVFGREVQDGNSTSFYNMSEVQEVVRRVGELRDCWPTSQWGHRDDRDILVTAAYSEQVSSSQPRYFQTTAWFTKEAETMLFNNYY